MATRYWLGGAVAVPQVQTFLFAGTWVVGNKITITYGSLSWVYTIASTTIATFLDALIAAHEALDATDYPAHAEQTATRSSATLTLTADTAGQPFTVTISTDSAAGTIGGASSSSGTTATASAGPYDVSTAANWSGATVPVSTDTAVIDREGSRLKYGLDQNAVTLAARRIVAQDVEIGLPELNPAGYPEYRQTYWKIGATSDYVSTASQRIKLDHGTVQTTYLQDASGSAADDTEPAVVLLGTHASNVWNILGGEAGLAFHGGTSAVVATLLADAGASVVCGTGVTIATVNNLGANVLVQSAIGTALNQLSSADALTTIVGSGAVAQITSYGGTIDYRTTGTLGGNTVLGGTAKLTFENDPRARTVTNAIQVNSSQVVVSDPFRTCNAGGTLTLNYVQCEPGTFDAGFNVAIARTLL
jgi:hypothetical protein